MPAPRMGAYQQMLHRCAGRKKLACKRVCLNGECYTLVMIPNPKQGAEEPILIFLTTLGNARKAAALYAKRWKIECLFKHLKISGYNLEELNLKNAGKNLLMMAIVARPPTYWQSWKAGSEGSKSRPSSIKMGASHRKARYSGRGWQGSEIGA